MSELYYTEMEVARNEAEDAYFMARPDDDTSQARRTFRAGYERAFQKLWNERTTQPPKCIACEDRPAAENDPCLVCGRRSQPPKGPHVHSMVLDRLGWICSVCYGWNHQQDSHCTHTHAVTKETPPPPDVLALALQDKVHTDLPGVRAAFAEKYDPFATAPLTGPGSRLEAQLAELTCPPCRLELGGKRCDDCGYAPRLCGHDDGSQCDETCAEKVRVFREYHGLPPKRVAPETKATTSLLDWLNEECCALQPIATPIADTGDHDLHWEVIRYQTAKPCELVVGAGRSAADAVIDAMKDAEDPTRWNYVPPEHRAAPSEGESRG